MRRRRVVILGAAGRDFHDFNVVFRDDPAIEVVAFTATQIPFIEHRTYPADLAGPLYPAGIAIHPEDDLEVLIRDLAADEVVFAYSDVTHEHVMHLASRSLAAGADFTLLGPDRTMLRSRQPVISVCAVRTGCGKSGIVRYAARVLREQGVRAAVIRHPMPYGDLSAQRCQRFETLADLDRQHCTVEEREEYEPLLRGGTPVFSGVDTAAVLAQAEQAGEVLLWDGGNNDLPFLDAGLEIVVVDPHRPGHETSFHPGEANLRRADLIVVNKVDSASPENIRAVEESARRLNPRAAVIRLASAISVEGSEAIRGQRVLAVEDGPTLTHGGMAYGAATLAARRFGAAELVDPRPHAVGSIAAAFRDFPHLGHVLPALGYSPHQLRELREAIEAAPCDLVLVGTPVDLGALLGLRRPTLRVRYEVEEGPGAPLRARLAACARETSGGATP
ncbi:MAG: GTPase [Deltaproteobacteria bacterium]|nr:GTPase [Deltaproteobacteria bacterium]